MLNPITTTKASSGSDLSVFPILLVNFIGTLGFSVVLPFLVVLVLDLGGNEVIYGLLGATYSFFQLIGAPILGRWSDVFGRKKILLLSQVGTFAAWILFFVALVIPQTKIMEFDSSRLGTFIMTIPLVLLFVARALDGITGGNISVANAYLSDISTDETRKSNFGKMSASANLGFIIGPALAGVLGATILGELLPVLATMGISLIAILVIQFVLKESVPCAIEDQTQKESLKKILGQEQKDCFIDEGSKQISFREILKLDRVGFMIGLYFLIFLSFNFFYVAFPIHAVQSLEWELFELGVFFSVMGGLMVLVQGPVLTWIGNRVSGSLLVILGSFILAGSFYLFSVSEGWVIYLAVTFFAVGNGIMWPSFLSILSGIAGKKFQGAIQGYAGSSGSLASIVGLIAGGFLYSLIGSLIFVIPSVVMIVIGFLSFQLFSVKNKEAND